MEAATRGFKVTGTPEALMGVADHYRVLADDLPPGEKRAALVAVQRLTMAAKT